MGCHTWFYRRCTQEELNYMKEETYKWLKNKCTFWNNVIKGELYKIPFEQVDCYDLLVTENSFNSEQERSEWIYKMIYENEYVETVSGIDDFVRLHPDYLDIDYNSLPDSEKEKLDIEAMYNNGFSNFLELQNHIKKFYGISFSEFCKIQKDHYDTELNSLDLSQPKIYTDKDDYTKLARYHLGSGVIKSHNGHLYTDAGCWHDVFRVYDYDAPTFDNPEELIDWVNNYKFEENEDLLTEEQIDIIRKFFEENNGDALVDFG